MRDLGARSFFLLAGVPAVLAIAVLTYVLYLRDVDSVKDDVQQTARAVSLSVDAEIVGAMKFLQAFVSSSEALEASDFETVRRKAVAALVASDVADGLAVTDATGQQLVNTFADDGDALPRTLHIDRIHQVFATGKPQVSDVLVGTVSRKHQVVIDVPVIRDGQVRYDSDIVLSSERFQTLLQSQRLPADWVVVVFDRNGTVVGRSQEHEKYVGQKVVRPLVERLQGDLEGTFEMSTLNGLPITGAYARSPVTGYGVAIGVPKQLLWARLRADLGWPALGIAAAMGASLLLGWRFGGVMQRRREAEHAALAEQQRLFDILETLPVYVVLLTHDGQVQFANRVFRENFGHLDESAEGNPLVAARQACRAIDSEAVPGTSGASNLIERIWNAPDGAVYSVTDQRVADVSGQPLILEMGVNVTRQKRAEGEQALLNRALRLVSECNSALVHVRDERALLESICQLVVHTGGYLMAWIGVAENDPEKTVRSVAQAGDDEGYLSSIQVSWGDNPKGRGPTGLAVRTQRTQVNQNCLTNPAMAPWREAALKRGYQASIALPLVNDGRAMGVLTIYALAPDAFHPQEVALLEQLADDLAFGVGALRAERARRQAVAGQRELEERYRLVLDNAADAVLIADPSARLVYVNRQASVLLDCPETTLLQRSLSDIISASGQSWATGVFAPRSASVGATVEVEFVRDDGRTVPVEVNTVRLPDGNLYAACRDISERKGYEAQLEYRSTHDALTALPNRNLLADRLEQSIAHARRTRTQVAVMLLDLDRFKLVNDSLGHEVGDALLQGVATTLKACVRAGDTVARLGGDEFVVVAADLSTEAEMIALAGKLQQAVSRSAKIGGHELATAASLGISVYPRDGQTSVELIKNADTAMYRAKELGRDGFQFYAPEMNSRMLERLELENGLRRALAQQELELHYQPKVDLRDGRVVGAEALIRWRHPILGLVPPGDFIPLAEENGLILPMGTWIIDTACAQLHAWKIAGFGDLSLAINISARQFQHDSLADTVAQALQRHGVAPSRLELEVTETAIMTRPADTAGLLQALKSVGVRISLDDFGTGYSSLNYLKRFPIDSLKIDQSFVRDITTDPDDAAIARLVIALGRDLGYKVIAEGVETPGQLAMLRQLGCDEMQGYLFSRPLPVAEFEALLSKQRHMALPLDTVV